MSKVYSLMSELEALILKEGGSLFGYACTKKIKDKFHLPQEVLDGLDYAISVGVRLNKDILKTNIDSPSILYKHHYRQVNMLLDRIASSIAELIRANGYLAIPIPASVIVDWKKDLGHVSHKEVGYLAGLGWRGKNNLLVNKNYGSAIRLVTVLTDLSLTPSTVVEEDCGSCTLCQTHCPAGAIKDSPGKFDRDACCGKVKEFSRKIGVGICGLCLGHCPEKGD